MTIEYVGEIRCKMLDFSEQMKNTLDAQCFYLEEIRSGYSLEGYKIYREVKGTNTKK